MSNRNNTEIMNEHKSVLALVVMENNFGFSETNSSIVLANSSLNLITSLLLLMKS